MEALAFGMCSETRDYLVISVAIDTLPRCLNKIFLHVSVINILRRMDGRFTQYQRRIVEVLSSQLLEKMMKGFVRYGDELWM